MVRLNATLGSVLQRSGYAEPEGSQRALGVVITPSRPTIIRKATQRVTLQFLFLSNVSID